LEKSKYGHLSNSERFGFWGINGDDLRLFVRGKVFHYLLPGEWPRGTLTSANQDPNGIIWLATPDGKLAKLSRGRWSKIIRTSGQQTELPLPSDLASTYRDSRGNLWNIGVATHPVTGLLRYLSLPSRGQPQKIAFNSFFEDREGRIWLATDGQGLYRIRQQAISVFSKEDGLPGRNIYPIYQDRTGAIWIGTWDAGLVRLSGGEVTTFSIVDGLLSKRINSISEDREGVLWVGTPAGLHRMQNGRFELVQNESLQGLDEVRAIHQDREGTLWFGTGQGLVRCQGGRWSVITSKDGLAGDDARVIIDGHTGNLWIGGYGGLTRLNHGEFRRWTQSDGLPSNAVRSLYEDREGVLWIGTYDGGLGRLENDRLTRYTMREGLFNNGVFQILEDSRGYLWMSCNRGIYRVQKSDLNEFAMGKRRAISSIAYGKSEGMRNAECNGGLWPAGVRTRKGELWFPTQDGVAIIDPDRVTVNLHPPPVVVESISMDRQPVEVDKVIRIPPGGQNLEIQYTALSLLNSDQIKFKYKMESLDRDWVEAGTRRTAYYSHLPPGNYVFTVIAANSDGVWNTQGKSLPVVVLPPFYRTWWFMTLAFATAAGAGWLAWRFRLSQLQRANAAQQAFSRQLIASQEAERKRIAGELHDSLGQSLAIIKNRALLSLSTPSDHERAMEQLREISEASTEAIHELKEIAHDLRPYQLDRLGFTSAIESMIRNMTEAHDLRLTLQLDQIDDLFSSEAEINIFRIVQESTNNVAKHAEATEAAVTIRRDLGIVQIVVRDNGRGFIPGAEAVNGGIGRGFGLTGMVERARLLGGSCDVSSIPGQGTTITISIPLKPAPTASVP
jgi:signal transduction histidine kinase/streptogramin lyase